MLVLLLLVEEEESGRKGNSLEEGLVGVSLRS